MYSRMSGRRRGSNTTHLASRSANAGPNVPQKSPHRKRKKRTTQQEDSSLAKFHIPGVQMNQAQLLRAKALELEISAEQTRASVNEKANVKKVAQPIGNKLDRKQPNEAATQPTVYMTRAQRLRAQAVAKNTTTEIKQKRPQRKRHRSNSRSVAGLPRISNKRRSSTGAAAHQATVCARLATPKVWPTEYKEKAAKFPIKQNKQTTMRRLSRSSTELLDEELKVDTSRTCMYVKSLTTLKSKLHTKRPIIDTKPPLLKSIMKTRRQLSSVSDKEAKPILRSKSGQQAISEEHRFTAHKPSRSQTVLTLTDPESDMISDHPYPAMHCLAFPNTPQKDAEYINFHTDNISNHAVTSQSTGSENTSPSESSSNTDVVRPDSLTSLEQDTVSDGGSSTDREHDNNSILSEQDTVSDEVGSTDREHDNNSILSEQDTVSNGGSSTDREHGNNGILSEQDTVSNGGSSTDREHGILPEPGTVWDEVSSTDRTHGIRPEPGTVWDEGSSTDGEHDILPEPGTVWDEGSSTDREHDIISESDTESDERCFFDRDFGIRSTTHMDEIVAAWVNSQYFISKSSSDQNITRQFSSVKPGPGAPNSRPLRASHSSDSIKIRAIRVRNMIKKQESEIASKSFASTCFAERPTLSPAVYNVVYNDGMGSVSPNTHRSLKSEIAPTNTPVKSIQSPSTLLSEKALSGAVQAFITALDNMKDVPTSKPVSSREAHTSNLVDSEMVSNAMSILESFVPQPRTDMFAPSRPRSARQLGCIKSYLELNAIGKIEQAVKQACENNEMFKKMQMAKRPSSANAILQQSSSSIKPPTDRQTDRHNVYLSLIFPTDDRSVPDKKNSHKLAKKTYTKRPRRKAAYVLKRKGIEPISRKKVRTPKYSCSAPNCSYVWKAKPHKWNRNYSYFSSLSFNPLSSRNYSYLFAPSSSRYSEPGIPFSNYSYWNTPPSSTYSGPLRSANRSYLNTQSSSTYSGPLRSANRSYLNTQSSSSSEHLPSPNN